MADDNELPDIVKAQKYATEILKNEVGEEYVYHQLEHTASVVESCKLIAEAVGLNHEEKNLVLIAAWFHDTGYSGGADGHEDRSKEHFRKFAEMYPLKTSYSAQIIAAIEATRMPQKPQSTIAEVLCDADLINLSGEDFMKTNQLLLTELHLTGKHELSELDWLKNTETLLTDHQYFTSYGKNVLEPLKAQNLEKIKKLRKDRKKKHKQAQKLEASIKSLNTKIGALGSFKPDRGIETMFRMTSKNHLELSSMADNKANIMISINSIVLSVVVSVLIRKIEESPFLMFPTLTLTTVCLATIVFAILSLIPNISRGKFSKKDIEERKVNLLFFGNFHDMPLPDYEWGVKEMMKDSDYLYGSLIKDIYYLGAVLGKKYKLLRTCYTIFMFGFVIAILSFILAYTLV
jgi:HD superfamily phosphodiesterase